MVGKRAPMLGKWPIPNKLSGKDALAGGLWIRRVLVRAQEGQLKSASRLATLSQLADFALVCCCSVPTPVVKYPPHPGPPRLIFGISNFDLLTSRQEGARVPSC
jgi:hypothetical protein